MFSACMFIVQGTIEFGLGKLGFNQLKKTNENKLYVCCGQIKYLSLKV